MKHPITRFRVVISGSFVHEYLETSTTLTSETPAQPVRASIRPMTITTPSERVQAGFLLDLNRRLAGNQVVRADGTSLEEPMSSK
jgi:hypothetical protein